VDPSTEERSYMGRPADAFDLMREIGIGISNVDIAKIQVGDNNLTTGVDSDGDGLSDQIEDALGTDPSDTDSDNDGIDDKTEILSGYDPNSSSATSLIDEDFSEAQAGKILIQVEQNGEAWYVFPEDNKRYFLARPADAFNIMRNLGLGISDANLAQVRQKGETSNSTNSSEANNSNGNADVPNGDREQARDFNFEELIASCSELSEGDICTYTDPEGNEQSGTCTIGKDEELMCHDETMMEAGPGGEKGEQGPGPDTDACLDLSEGDTCTMENMEGESMEGICSVGRDDELMCRPEDMPEPVQE